MSLSMSQFLTVEDYNSAKVKDHQEQAWLYHVMAESALDDATNQKDSVLKNALFNETAMWQVKSAEHSREARLCCGLTQEDYTYV